MSSSSKCVRCGKTAYPLESVAAANQVWHKVCFKCQAEGCGITLTLKTFTEVSNMVYCPKHVPKDKPTQVTVNQSMALSNALAAQKEGSSVNKVNKEQRGELVGQKSGEGLDSMGLGKAVESQKLGSAANKVNNEQRGELVGQKPNMSNDSLFFDRSKETQKLASAVNRVSNEQRGELVGQKNSQTADMATQNAINAPKIGTVNTNFRGELAGQRNAQVPDMTTQTALNAPKVDVVNEQVRTEHARARAKGQGVGDDQETLDNQETADNNQPTPEINDDIQEISLFD